MAKAKKTKCAYFTRNMPIVLRDRLHEYTRRISLNGEKVTMEEVVNKALSVGLTVLENKPAGWHVDWSSVPDDEEDENVG